MFKDLRGLEYTVASGLAMSAFDQTIDAFFRLSEDTGACLKVTLEADPTMPMAHCLQGYFFLFMASTPLIERAKKSYRIALDNSSGVSPREQAHIVALGHWCEDDKNRAMQIWDQILTDHPLDVVALRLGYYANLYLGNSNAMRHSLESTLHAWDPLMPNYSHFLGMRSFAFEEGGDYELAEKLGRQAVEMDPYDPWAIHAVSHIMEMQERRVEGVKWINEREANWLGANNFRYHLIWHLSLMYWGLGDFDRVLQIYDERLWDSSSDEFADLCNDASILMRLEYMGVSVGDRWLDLHAKVENRAEEHILVFADVHFASMFASVGDMAGVSRLVESFSEKGGTARMEVGLPLAQAVADYCSGAYTQAQKTLLELRGRIIEIGGSHAQRDIFELMMIEASIKSGDIETARNMLENRTKLNPNNGLNWKKLAKLLPGIDDVAAKFSVAQAAQFLVS